MNTHMINRIPIKLKWFEKKYYIDKRCTKMGGSKYIKEPNEKRVIYSISKDQSSKSG
jgi:hypothetical protein